MAREPQRSEQPRPLGAAIGERVIAEAGEALGAALRGPLVTATAMLRAAVHQPLADAAAAARAAMAQAG